jgi:hypothetical protein
MLQSIKAQLQADSPVTGLVLLELKVDAGITTSVAMA